MFPNPNSLIQMGFEVISMRIKGTNLFCRFNKSGCLPNSIATIKKNIMKYVLCAVVLFTLTIGHSYAGTWRDEFDGNELNGWERVAEDNPWFAKWILIDDPGFLYGGIVKPKQEGVTAADFLHWNLHKFKLKHLTVVGEEIDYDRHAHNRSGELCLFPGKRQTEPDFAEGYILSPEKATKMQFTANGIYKIGEVKADYGLMFRLTSSDIKVVFDTGKFRFWTQDLLITEFFDAETTKIDVVGMMVLFEFPGDWFSRTISTFSISDILDEQTHEVQLGEMQLTITWGELKRF